ncbi:MAG TPA: wax ester/triacylglycerol synthase domain-containing protein, partial [Ornithinibacter sp.]|nr:wax ester/triacylglycerol synthase domain-containing protein [Ornithinibacter sp.]
MAQRRPIAPLDSIWLSMDRPHNLMVIVSVMFLGAVPDWDEVTALLETRVLDRYPVFRQRMDPAGLLGGRPHWVDDEAFDLRHHLRRATLPGPGDDAALQRYMERHVSTPLDPAHPLWEMHLLDGHGSGAAIFTRTHHALADGLALARVLLSLTDDDDDAGPPTDSPIEPPGTGGARAHGDGSTGSTGSTRSPLWAGIDLARTAAGGTLRWGTPRGLRDASRLALRTTQVVTDLLLGHNPQNPLTGSPAPEK